jgi:ABC-2 type transport system permease protein
VTNNGVFAALVITLPVFLPLAVSIVAGDVIAAESGLATIHYLLIRAAGRSRLLGVKAATVAFCIAAPSSWRSPDSPSARSCSPSAE